MEKRPLLFVDVDGVISLFGFASGAAPAGDWALVEGIAHLISGTAGEHLRQLGDRFEIVWCTGWEERADEHLPALLGLADSYPHLTFERNPGRVHAHWKLDAIDTHAGARPLAWIDDALDDSCRSWARRRTEAGAPTLLVETDPAVGMTAGHVSELLAWTAR
jgi:Swiss Army Knife RNA repair-like protein